MPLFIPQVTPFALYDGDTTVGSAAAGVANTAYLVGVTLYTPAVLTGIRWKCTAGGAGHYDVGIYDASGTNSGPNNLLAHAATIATSLVTSTAILTPAFIGGNLPLSAGRYWLALWIDNATDTIQRATTGGGTNIEVVQSGTNAGPLPALASSLSGLANTSFRPLLMTIFQGSWS